jgi:O-antigen ligase
MSFFALGFVLSFFLLLVLSLSRHPIFGLYAYLEAFYLHPPGQWWGQSLPDLRWAFLAASVLMISTLIHKNKLTIYGLKFTEVRLFLVFTLFVCLQYFWALSPEIHIDYMVLCLKFLILIILIQSVINGIKEVYGFILANLVGCAYLGYQGFGIRGRLENLGLPGINGSNHLAQHLSVVLVFAAFLLLMRFGKKEVLLYPLYILVLNGIILTESRSVVIALAVTGLFLIFMNPQDAKKKFYLYAALAIIGFGVLLGPGLVTKMQGLSITSGQDSRDLSTQSRFHLLEKQWEIFLESPILGSGHRGTLLLSPLYIDQSFNASNQGQNKASHNFVMTLLVDHGLVGASMYLLVIFLTIKKGINIRKLHVISPDAIRLRVLLTGFVAALICLLVAGMGSNNKVLEIDIWLYALIGLLYSKINSESVDSKQTLIARHT